jgi:PiT family inorganic phosphate transporter
LEFIKLHHAGEDNSVVEQFIDQFQQATLEGKRALLDQLSLAAAPAVLSKFERKQLRKVYKQQLVKRSEVLKIVAAWLITVPATALMAALIYFMIFGMVHA